MDRIGDESSYHFSIWDYKTGRIYKKYRDADPFAQGRLVQHALYMMMAESVLKRKVNRKAVVEQAGYYFPTGRGQGERIVRTREQLADADFRSQVGEEGMRDFKRQLKEIQAELEAIEEILRQMPE